MYTYFGLQTERVFMTKQIIICVSGEGSNAKRLCEYFSDTSKPISIFKILSTKHNPTLQKVAHRCDTYFQHIGKKNMFWKVLINASKTSDLIVLAGFLWVVPGEVIFAIKNNMCRIMNIHPGPLPETEALYGNAVHHFSITSGSFQVYHTFHWVEKKLDGGLVIENHSVHFKKGDPRTIEILSNKIKASEHKYLGPCIERLLLI